MKKKLKDTLRSKRGESYVDVVILVLVAIAALVLSLNVFSFLVLKQDLDYVASQMSDIAALEGMTQSAKITSTFEELCSTENINADDVTLVIEPGSDGYFSSQKHQVQLGDTITVTITCKAKLIGFGSLSKAIDLDCVSTKSSLSRVYWKDSD